MKRTTSKGLQVRYDTPQVMPNTTESFNATTIQHDSKVNSPVDESMPIVLSGCGYNSRKRASISGKHNVFVLACDGKPLTPTTNAKARKLMKGEQAKPVWNKFGKFGIQMTVDTGKVTPQTALGCDYGTKFEGYAVVVGTENNLSAMWKLPNKKNIVRKMTERKQLRRARRFRKCRRSVSRGCNLNNFGVIAPSQMVMIQSRQKAMREFFKCYPIDTIAIEDVRFNHAKHRWGRNFSTIEVGKKSLYEWCKEQSSLQLYRGHDTQELRKKYDYKKSKKKNAEVFNAHCSDALTIAVDVFVKHHVCPDNFVVVDDTYRFTRRRIHDTQFSKGGLRHAFARGNYRGIRKGTMCNFGLICGGTGNSAYIYSDGRKRISRTMKKISWLSHHFNVNHAHNSSPCLKAGDSL